MAKANRVAFVPEAKQEAKQAREWYERQQPGLGRQFMQEVRAAVERIRQSPQMYPPVKKSYRQVIL